jgi:hypothetical protein
MASTDDSQYEFDVFVSHASEDKDAVVRPLAEELDVLGLNVWYDEFEAEPGDSLREIIDEGLKGSNYGAIVLSQNFFGKGWPENELNGLFQRQMSDDEKVIIPLWYGIGHSEVKEYSPSLADLKAIEVSPDNIQKATSEIYSLVQKNTEDASEEMKKSHQSSSSDVPSFRNVDIRFESQINLEKSQQITLKSWRNHHAPKLSHLEAVEIYDKDSGIDYSSDTTGTVMTVKTIKNSPLTGMVLDIDSISSGKTEFTMRIEESQLEKLPEERSHYRSL